MLPLPAHAARFASRRGTPPERARRRRPSPSAVWPPTGASERPHAAYLAEQVMDVLLPEPHTPGLHALALDRFLFGTAYSTTVRCMRSSDPAPTALDRHLRRVFGDNDPTGFGSGWVAGVGSLLGGALGFFAVLCFHFPQLLTAPVLRSRYPVPLLRGALQAVLIASVLLGLFNVALRRLKVRGLTGLF